MSGGAPARGAWLVAGVGSRACRDDGVGLELVERLRGRVPVALWEDRDALDVASELLEAGGPVLLVDCADMGLGAGEARAFDADAVGAREHRDTVSTHGLGLADALRLARALGYAGTVRVFGVQPFDVRPGLGLTAEMAARLDDLERALLAEVAGVGAGGGARGVTVVLHGLVQGVGMRPTVARLAREAGLGGFVQNRAGSLLLRVEGAAAAVEGFLAALPGRLPPRARVERLERIEDGRISSGGGAFVIRESAGGDAPAVVVPPDLAACPACLAEVRDPAGRRYGYPFTTCTDCGPRYSVVERTPYDRERTTLARFPLCPECAREYADPDDRRCHAESTACPACGPRLVALSGAGAPVEGDPLRAARAVIAAGGLVAVRGVGGFQLVVDARRTDAIARLRREKARPHRPLAVMASLEAIARACRLDPDAEAALRSPAAPIVLLEPLPGADGLPLDALAPDTDRLGVMLPTTPLHDLLLRPLPGDPTVGACWRMPSRSPLTASGRLGRGQPREVHLVHPRGCPRPVRRRLGRWAIAPSIANRLPALDWLVVTSGNRRGEPLCTTTAEALDRLSFADLVLTHDREIAWRCDDSVVAPVAGGVQVLRRARGYAPEPIRLPRPGRRVLAMGAGLRNTVALSLGDRVVVSPHVGDLADPACLDACEALARALPALLDARPEAVAVDLHPDLGATRLGERLAAELGVPVVRVQHHHAHAAACLAEHGLEEGLALVWDGVGLGDDGALWGGELLHLRAGGAERLGTFAPAPLPGGDAAVLEPRRQLAGRLFALGLPPLPGGEAWEAQCRRGLNAPATHAVGRLFDAAAAALGLAPDRVTWEGQAAVRLEAAARAFAGAPPRLELPVVRDGLLVVDWRPALRGLLGGPSWSPEAAGTDRRASSGRAAGGEPLATGAARPGAPGSPTRARGGLTSTAALALAFHEALARAAAAQVAEAPAGLPVALCGGVFQNRLLAVLTRRALEDAGRTVLEARAVPPNDGGVSFGQAVVAGRA